jgi:hypothetical protein
MKPPILLRWGAVIDTVQRLVARGDLGKGLRLYQSTSGDWELVETADVIERFGNHRIEGGFFIPSPALTFEGQAAELDGVPVDAEIPQSKELEAGQLTGPTTVYLETVRLSVDDVWEQPAQIKFANGIISGGSDTVYFQPIALIQRGLILTLT